MIGSLAPLTLEQRRKYVEENKACINSNRRRRQKWVMRTSLIIILLICSLIAMTWLRSNPGEESKPVIPADHAAINSDSAVEQPIQTEHKRHLPTNTSDVPVYADEEFLSQLNQPYAFGVDPTSRRLIWTSAGDETFKTANSDGSDIRAIPTNFEDPYDLEIDSSFGHTLFLISEGTVRRRTVDLQANTHTDTVLFTLPTETIHGLGYDEHTNMLYLGDSLGRPRFAISLSDEPKITIKTITLLTHSTQEEP